MRSRSDASTAWAVARLWGWTVQKSPVRSITQERAGVGIVDRRRRRARPALDRLAEVLGLEDLDRVIRRERGAGRVGPRPRLAPERALGEVSCPAPPASGRVASPRR